MVTAALHNPKSTLAGNRAVETSLTFDASGRVIQSGTASGRPSALRTTKNVSL
jgi:hypothetical protein